jgi:hypothetical protein
VAVQGRVVPVLDLGLGFHPDLTGLENLRTTARLLGLDEDALAGKLDEIVAFSGIGSAVEASVKQYSTGMRARLGLALALHADADLLLIDELLTVGDTEFRQEVLARLAEAQASGVSVVFVSHELGLIEELCERVIRLERGRLVDDGPADEVITRYGGRARSRGAVDAIGGVRLHEMEPRRRLIPIGGEVEFAGLIEVIEPSPSARLELSYRDPTAIVYAVDAKEDRDAESFFVTTVVPVGSCLSSRGWYRYRARVPDNRFVGRFDLVLAAVDADTGEVLSETWVAIISGHHGDRGHPVPVFEIDWEMTPIA